MLTMNHLPTRTLDLFEQSWHEVVRKVGRFVTEPETVLRMTARDESASAGP
jgi:hypothetical protein